MELTPMHRGSFQIGCKNKEILLNQNFSFYFFKYFTINILLLGQLIHPIYFIRNQFAFE